MEIFELQAPIKSQILAILEDYPGGQILEEGLQNAEDSKASSSQGFQFAWILDATKKLVRCIVICQDAVVLHLF